jgi:dipeptidyl-peptidase-4
VEYPELAARTRGFTAGAPRSVSVSGDGTRVFFLRSTGPTDPVTRLWMFDVANGSERLICDPADIPTAGELPDAERALRERLRLSAAGIGSYAADATGRIVAFPLAGTLVVADVVTGEVRPRVTPGSVVDPRPDPTGASVAYVSDAGLHVLDLRTDSDMVLAAEPDTADVTWGLAEFIGAEATGATGGRRTAVRCWPPGSTTHAWRGGTCTTRPTRRARPGTSPIRPPARRTPR